MQEWENLLCKINFIINSRPLIDENENCTILPILANWLLYPYNEFNKEVPSLIDMTGSLKQTIGSFWKTWQHFVATNLFHRNKWKHKTKNLQVGDIFK